MNDTPTGIALWLSQFVSIISAITTFITGNVIMMTMFAGGLFVVGAKVFKRIKNASK